ncbi:ester cyclase [Salinibacter sp.]|uniref:ester cyclase n=1 Tax=Salinibacter sp. TaxID=2065818 RepID=UPI0021E8C117|nr:ester cyclase [Salinibacter sp.]
MSSDIENTARRYLQAWNSGERHVVNEIAAQDLVVSYTHYPEPYHGPEAFKEMLAKTHHFFPDLSIDVRDVVADENQAFVRWTYQGTFQNGEMFGISASGQSVEVTGMTVLEIEDDMVKREEGVVDNLALMQQLGLSPGRPDSE